MRLKNLFSNHIFQTLMVALPGLISSFLVGIFIVQILGPTGKGVLGLISFNIELLVLILGLSLGSAITYFISNKKIKPEKVLSISAFLLASALVVALVAYFTIDAFGYSLIVYSPEFLSPTVVLYFFLTFFFQVFKLMAIAFLQGYQKIKWINVNTLIIALVNFMAITPLFLYLFTNDQLQQTEHFTLVIQLLILSNLITISPLIYFVLRTIRKENLRIVRFSIKDDFKPMIRFALIGHLSNVINFFNYRIDIWFISYFFFEAFDLLSFYLIAVTLSQIIWQIPTAINLVYFPRLCENPSISTTIRITRLNTLLTSICIIIGLILAPILIPELYGAEFGASVLPFQLLLIGIFFGSLSKTMASFIFAKGRVTVNLIGTIVGLLVTLILDYLLIPKFGIVGASWATNVTYFSIFLVCLGYMWRVAKKEGIGIRVFTLMIPGLLGRNDK